LPGAFRLPIRLHGRTERQTEDGAAAEAPAVRATPTSTRSAIKGLAGSLYERSLRDSSVGTVLLRAKAVQRGQRSRRRDLEERAARPVSALGVGARPSAAGGPIEISIRALNHLIRTRSVRAVWQSAKVIQRSQLALGCLFVEVPGSVPAAREDRSVDRPIGPLNRRSRFGTAGSFWVEAK